MLCIAIRSGLPFAALRNAPRPRSSLTSIEGQGTVSSATCVNGPFDNPFAAIEGRGPDRKGRGVEVRERVSRQSVRRKGSLWSRMERRRRTMSATHLEAGAEAGSWAVAGLVAGRTGGVPRSSGRGMVPSNEQRSAEASVKVVGSPGGPSRAFGSPTKGSIEPVASEPVLFGGARLRTLSAASREASGGQEGRSGRGRRESCTKSL